MPGQTGIAIGFQDHVDGGFRRLTELLIPDIEAAGRVTRVNDLGFSFEWATADVDSLVSLTGSGSTGEHEMVNSEREFQLVRQAAK